MPGNKVEDGICNLFELENSSQGQHLSRGVDVSWSALNDKKQRQSVVTLNFNLQNYGVQQLDPLRGLGGGSASVQYKPNYSKLTPIPENYGSHSRNYQLNTNGSLLGNQSFQKMQNQPRVFGEFMSYDQHSLTLRALSTLKSQPEYESGTDSPTLTANSERSEITEVSTDFTFLIGQQQLARDHQPGISQPGPMQQSGYSDMQLLQQHMMFKQLQELQRQQQLQQLGDVRQQNSMNQLSAMSKQAAGIQFSPLNGTPINDAAQMFMNWPQFSGASSVGQGVANRLMFSPENGQHLLPVGHVPQPLDGSLYGTPVATSRGNTGQYSQLQGIPQAQKPVVQTSGFSNPFVRDESNVSPDQLSMRQGALIPNQGFPGKNMFGDVPNQGLNSGVLSGSFQEGNSPQTNTSVKEFSGRQEQTGWPVMQQKTMQHSPPLGLVPLDPVEEKILYNMDDTTWDASLGRRPEVGAVGIGNTLETTELANSFPSIQSGSWSALMQSAVAEASSSDTGLQEEWSGLTFQNTEQSTDNHLSNFMESDNQLTGWVDNNLQSASSFSSKPLHTMNDSSISSSFPGFQQQGIQFPIEQRRGLHQDGSHESMEKSPKVIGEWIDCNPQQKPSSEASQQVQSLMHLNNAWAGQVFEHSEGEAQKQRTDSHREDSQMNFSDLPYSVLDHQTTNQQVMETNQSEYLGCTDIPIDKDKETMERNSQPIGNGPHVYNNPYGGECETHEKQNSYFQSKNSNSSYNSQGSSVLEQGFSGQFHFFGNASSNSINLEQGHLPHLWGNTRASEELPSKDDLITVGSDGSDVAAQASQNMLELLHKVDQSRDDGNITSYGSADYNLLARLPKAEIAKSGSQLCNQSSTSQSFGLRLSPPSQRLPNLSHLHTSHAETIPYPNSRQVNSELGEKNQTWLATSSSVQTLPRSHDLSQRTRWDDKSNASGQIGTSSFLNEHGKSATAYTPDSTNIRNHPHMQLRSGTPVASQSSQAKLQLTGIRQPLFNLSASQDNSRQMGTNHLGHQFPVLEAMLASQPSVLSGVPQQDDVSARPHKVRTNVPSQRPPTVPEHLKGSSYFPSSKDPSNNSTVCTPKGGFGSSEFGTGSEQQTSSEIIDNSKHILDAGALHSGYLVSNSHQLDLDRVKNEDNHAHGATGRNTASIGHSLESSSNLHQNYSLLDQVRAMKNQETYPNKKSSGGPHDSFPSKDANMMKFLTEDDPSVRALSQPALQGQPTNETVQFYQNNSQNQSRINNLVSNLMEHSQVNPHMVPSWWKQFGTLKNGQMLPMYNAKVATGQLSLGKPSQNLQIHASVERVDTADAIQCSNIMPNTVATSSGTEHISAPHVLPTDITSQSMAVMRPPKKRKSVTFEPRPWHKEVTEGSQLVQNMRMAEECWAQITDRVIEKMEDEVELAEELQPMLRSKRRLILTTQLMQQLFFPAPKSSFLADMTSHHDSVIYFISRIALGDACNFTCCSRNDQLGSMDSNNVTSQKLKAIEGTDGQRFSEVVDELSARARKLENDFQRVDKTASVVDIRVECQELERFAVVNRFAKFHIRAQADASGISSSGPTRPFLQRYVTALPMPRKFPEGLYCISL